MRFTTGLFKLIFVFVFLSPLLIWLFLARPFVFSSEHVDSQNRASPVVLEKHVRKLSEDFSPRDWTNPKNLNRAADYIADEFKLSNSKVSFQRFEAEKVEYKNVISEYGTASDLGTVVIGAHYDSYSELPGADDNASGVAGLLELGRLLSKEKVPFKVLLVAYSLEEPPFFRTDKMGSAVHAESLIAPNERVKLMISLEMIGYFTDVPDSQEYPSSILKLIYPTVGDFIAIIGKFDLSLATVEIKKAFSDSTNLKALSMNAPAAIPGIDFSDHLNYWERGMDAVMITDTAFLRNKNYHKQNDTYDRLNYAKMSQVIEGVLAYLLKN